MVMIHILKIFKVLFIWFVLKQNFKKGVADAYMASYKVEEYTESIKKFKFPNEILNKFDNIVWSEFLKF